jgi:2-oxoglutarate dehydrogenase E2 component (dihydrolipoamide succinyltransferase)
LPSTTGDDVIDVQMPQLGETVTEGTITRWLKRPGDIVAAGEPLVEVSTDKVESEVPAPAGGTLAEIIAGEGETIAVGVALARIVTDAAPAVEAPVVEPVAVTESPAQARVAGEPLLSPSVRRALASSKLDPSTIRSTGGRGRLTTADVMGAVDASVQPGSDHITWPAQPTVTTATTSVPFSPIRKRIARHMVHSKATAAHAWVSVDVDFANVERARSAAQADFSRTEGTKLTYLPFIARASIDALVEFPLLNATIGDDELLVRSSVHLGIAVDLDFEGLVVAVAREAQDKSLRSLAREMTGLAELARARRIPPDQVAGSTFTITNVGSHGAVAAMPIINQPELAVLATGIVSRRPVVVALGDGTEGVAIHPVGSLSLSWDHRGVDGAYASAFLRTVTNSLQTQDWNTELAR